MEAGSLTRVQWELLSFSSGASSWRHIECHLQLGRIFVFAALLPIFVAFFTQSWILGPLLAFVIFEAVYCRTFLILLLGTRAVAYVEQRWLS